MKKSKKRLTGVVTAITSVALGGAVAVSLIAPIKVFAKAANVHSVGLFTDESETVVSLSGIEVDTSKHVGEINGVFSGDFETEFAFSRAGFGSTEFAFYDKDNTSTKVFSVVYTIKDSNTGSALVFDYRDNTFHAFNENGAISSVNQWTVDSFNVATQNEAYPNTLKADTVGKLGVYFSGNTVSVKVSQGWNGVVSDNVELANLTVNGLSDGYIVKMESNSVYSALGRSVGYDSVVVKTVNGKDFVNGGLDGYSLSGTIQYEGEYEKDEKNIIEIKQAQELSDFKFSGRFEIDFSANGLGSFVSNPDAEILFGIDESFEDRDPGEYDLTVEFGSLQKNYSVKVSEGDTCSPSELFTFGTEKKKLENGVRVNTLNKSAEINSTFFGDFEMEFAFTQSGFYTNEIAFYSKTNVGEKIFSVVYSIKDSNVGTALVFDYVNSKYYAFSESGDIPTINQWTNDAFNVAYQVEAYPNGLRNATFGKLGVYFDGDKATVKVSEGWDGTITNFVKLAEISVPSLRDGYVVKAEGNALYTNLSRTNGTDKLLIGSINGISCAKEKIACVVYDETIEHADEYEDGGISVVETTEGNPIGKFNYVRKFKIDCTKNGFCEFNCKNSITQFDIPTDYQNKGYGEYTETVKFANVQKEYLIKIQKGDLAKSKDILSANADVKYFEDDFNKGYAVNTKNADIRVGEYLHGDLELEYAYTKSGYGATEFTVYDVDDPQTKVFSVLRTYNYDNKGTAFVIDYRINKAIALDVESDMSAINAWYPWAVANSDDKKEIYPNNAGFYSKAGKIGLTFDGDSVEIKVSQGWDGEITNYLTLATLTVPNLSDGYILKLTGSTLIRDKGDDSIVITAINGCNLSRENLPCQVIDSFIRHPNEYTKENRTFIDVPLGGNISPFDFVNEVDISGIVVSTVKESFLSQKNVSDKKVGEYAQTVSHNGIAKNYVINIVPAYKTETIFTGDSNASFISAGGNKGVRVKPYRQEATFNGVFNGDLEIEFAYENSSYGTVRFDFYDKDDPNESVFSIYRSFGIGRPERIEQGFVETTWGTAFVGYNGKFYALEQEFANATDAVLYCQDRNISYYPVNNTKASDPHCNFTDKWNIPGKLLLTWNGDSVTIEATVGEGANVTEKNTVAVLNLPNLKDGYNVKLTGQGYDEFHECEEGIVILGVNGTKFDNDYTGSSFFAKDIVYNGFKNGENGIFLAKNGELGSFACKYNYEFFALRWQKSVIDDEEFVKAGFGAYYEVDATSVGTKQMTVTPVLYGYYGEPKTYTVYVEESAKIELNGNGGNALNDLYYSEHTFGFDLPTAVKENWKFGGWYSEDSLFEGFDSFASLTDMTLTAHWYDDTCPEIKFVGNDSSVIRITEETDALSISAQDVTAYDGATDKIFAKEEISVSVKTPNSEEYVPFDEFVFNNKLFGAYFIKYSATDDWISYGDTLNNNNNYSSNNVGELIRVVYYSAERPTIALDEEVATTAYVGMKIRVPHAIAKVGDKTLDYEVTLTVQDKDGIVSLIEIGDGICFDREGIYRLVYFATDECGQSVMEKYETVCKKDVNKPQIHVVFDLSELKVGQTLQIPQATATDEEFGALDVSVEILYKNRVVATGDTVVNDEGVYTVRYTAIDGANNIAIKEFDVMAVNSNGADTGKKGGCFGDSGMDHFVGVILLSLVSVAFVIKKRKA